MPSTPAGWTGGAQLTVRDYDGNPAAAAIVVEERLVTDATGALRLEFDADAWDSAISFAPGIPAALGGTLELNFAPGVDIATETGRTIDLFDWTGVMPTGAFTISSPYSWNLSQLYTTGEVTLVSAALLPGVYNGDGVVDAADYTVWRVRLGSTTSPPQRRHAWCRTRRLRLLEDPFRRINRQRFGCECECRGA